MKILTIAAIFFITIGCSKTNGSKTARPQPKMIFVEGVQCIYNKTTVDRAGYITCNWEAYNNVNR